MSDTNPIDLAFMFVERINRQDLDGLIELMTVDHTFFSLEGTMDYNDRHKAGKAWREYFESFPNYMIHLSEAYNVSGGAALVGRTTGSHQQLPRIEEFAQRLIWQVSLNEGQVQTWRIFRDSPDARAYLGMPPEPGFM